MTSYDLGAPTPNARSADLQRLGVILLYAGLTIVFFWFGSMKFTAYEAHGIAPFVVNSPLTSWLNGLVGERGAARVIGVVELSVGVLLAARLLSPRAATLGALGSIATYLTTVSFLFTTPGVAAPEAGGFPAISAGIGQFLLKDLVLLAASVYLLGESLAAAARRAKNPS